MRLIFLGIGLLMLLCYSCNDDDKSSGTVAFNFTHTWNSTTIDQTNLTTVEVVNANGEVLNIARIRYLVSRFELTDINGNSYPFEGFKFTDVSEMDSYNFQPDNNTIPEGIYTLKFIWGFNEEDNIDGAYPILNSASWNWPQMLGGGYHFLQLDGTYNVNSSPSPYNFHNGTARASTNPNVFEQNFAEIILPTQIEITGNTSIEIIMNFAEFFKTPHQWDLNVLDTPLMPNYTAQKMMQDNVQSVFSIGTVNQ